jgi:hypothetical protein
MYKIYLIYVYMPHAFTYKIYLIYIFTYALGDINFVEYVVQSFILSRRIYVNKIIFDIFCFILFISCKNTLKLFGDIWETWIHAAKICNFQNMYFWVSIFFAKQYIVRYLCEERTLEMLLQNTMYFGRYKKGNFLTNIFQFYISFL